ncbi:MAG TPA: cytochrome c oxidase assembly protein, partial [Acidimicrobiales bacterium]|nr:cytochrome c oxidase assembly protein [Acidimicrobiales bacterium]
GRTATVLAACLRPTSGTASEGKPALAGGHPLRPVAAAVLSALVLWAWHLPELYQVALAHEGVHAAEHAAFLGAAVLFWGTVATGWSRGPGGRPAAALGLFVSAVQGTALGAVLTFAGAPLYSTHAVRAAAWGMPALSDQQLAGVIMWVPPGLVYLATMVVLLIRWFSELEEPAPALFATSPAAEGR